MVRHVGDRILVPAKRIVQNEGIVSLEHLEGAVSDPSMTLGADFDHDADLRDPAPVDNVKGLS
ncbi:MAG: hypothetical protein JO121_00585 [Deltaproteobacteria bacterium]|nr:hypothetical protein [Deltaproteobacteria bacterium]